MSNYSFLHDNESEIREILRDGEDDDNPQGNSVPDSIRESALQELRRRGYNQKDIEQIRLGKYSHREN